MKIIITPIGIESSTGRQYAPVLEDGRFIYIPIPEFSTQNPKHQEIISNLKSLQKNSYNFKTYNEIPIEPWLEYPENKHIGDFLSNRTYLGYPLRSYIPHFDPEFITLTYGEGSHNKAKTLSSLEKGDMLVFYMSLSPPFQNKSKGKFIVGYFTIEKVYDYRFKGVILDYNNIDNRIKNNMHIIRRDIAPVIVVGKPNESRLFKYALQFTDNKRWEILEEILQKIRWPHKTNIVHMGIKVLYGAAAKKFRDLVINHERRILQKELSKNNVLIQEFTESNLERPEFYHFKEKFKRDIKTIIIEGEGLTTEFKSSLRWDFRLNSVNKVLEFVIVKEISGFLNSEGGLLLIGVGDNGKIIGLERDYKSLKKKDKDGFSNHIVQVICNYIGEEFGDFWRIRFLKIDNIEICVVDVNKSPDPVYIKNKNMEQFYIRKGTSTRPLSIREAHKYIKHHFKN